MPFMQLATVGTVMALCFLIYQSLAGEKDNHR
jgi:hypothetical protein